MARVGILGGSFDPVHLGHVRLAAAARDRLGLDRVVLVPAAQQPLKVGRNQAPAADRLAMARLAAAGLPWLEVSDVEVERGGVSYTVDTLRRLRQDLPIGTALTMIVGADVLQDLGRWRNLDEILRLVTVAVSTRPGHSLAVAPDVPGERFEFDALPISATEVRRRIAAGEPAGDLLPPAVAKYIEEKGLYR